MINAKQIDGKKIVFKKKKKSFDKCELIEWT